ncbi:hypothetical protein HMPREF1250_0763 [Megasphaera vaginalis (ex Srinivasan et al. 2021)]|uniref:Uncharacterized protein n=1 Tax=Megasphaera vaginalis (ex Srinivasan et al. 2021) TaxID=1111454 RepID=U7UK02_9FIRM|nr:hypothetical protein HMPREF1250_0763 [Megasphaera vaginalis (ex Srinivasan et al. 2021)]
MIPAQRHHKRYVKERMLTGKFSIDNVPAHAPSRSDPRAYRHLTVFPGYRGKYGGNEGLLLDKT